MPLKPRAISTFIMYKLPAAYFTGVRAKAISDTSCTTSVRYRWINQNPFKSMFWAVQAMAAELSTGALVMSVIRESGQPISMLLVNNKATFSKKAVGRINFVCEDGEKIKEAIEKAIETGEGQTCWMHSKATNKEGEIVSQFDFEWTLKLKNK